MSDRLGDRVNTLLDDAEEELDELPDLEDRDGDADGATDALEGVDGLDDLADEASDTIETNDSGELLEAVGLAELSDGSEPESIPDAIARGDPEDVVELQAVLKLANLADREGDELLEGVDELRETIADRSVDEIEESGSGDETGAGAVDESPDETDDGGEANESDLTEQLQSVVSGDLEGFRDELEQAREHFEGLRGDGESYETDEESADEEETEEDEDGGLLGGDESSSRGTRHSTMAPPPSKRADMGRSSRHSTMPDRR